MIQRGGEVVIRMLENVKQVTIGPLIKQTIIEGSLVYTDEYDIYSRLVEWGYGHETICHAAGEYALDDDGGRILRSACQHDGRVLVAAPFLAPSPPRNPSGEPASVPGVLRVRAQRPGSWQTALACPDRSITGTTLQSIMSLLRLAIEELAW